MIAKLERIQSNVQQNMEETLNSTMAATIKNESTKTEPTLRTDSSLSHRGGGGGLDASYWYQIFALDSIVVKAQDV